MLASEENESQRLVTRLSRVPGLTVMPTLSSGWILALVEKPREIARTIARNLSPGLVSVPRHLEGAIRITVDSDPKINDSIVTALQEALRK